jgi:thiamine-phosphate pyrophosphorylase
MSMDRNKDVLAKARLYVVLDRQVCDYPRLFEILRQAVGRSGKRVDVVQLRDKAGAAREVLQFARSAVAYLKGRAPFIVNDRVDLAIASGAGGVHLGQEDLPIAQARRMMGSKAIIGVSCQTLAQARLAQKQGADYIGWGSVFKTLTKPDRQPLDLSRLARDVSQIKTPVFVIGGITLNNVGRLTDIGLKKIAVTRAICQSRNVPRAVENFRKVLDDQ